MSKRTVKKNLTLGKKPKTLTEVFMADKPVDVFDAEERQTHEIKDSIVATLAEWKEAALILQEILTKIKKFIP